MNNKIIKYRPSPTLKRFHESRSDFKGIRGPVGSGKSVGCCMEVFKNACEQVPFNGVRKTRIGIIRNSYGELKTTTIKTWLDWFEDITSMVYSSPIIGTVSFNLPDGTRVESELLFVSQDRPKDIKRVLSLDLTMIWVNEGKLVPYALIIGAKKRKNRYPNKIYGGATYPCMIADTNSCDIDCWWYNLSEKEKPAKHEFFDQPPALIRHQLGKEFIYEPNPDAENIENLSGFDYYLDMIPGSVKEDIEVYVLNHYGSSEPGNKVYADYSTENHTDVVFNPHLAIHWTHDFNFSPLSSAILQVSKDKVNVYAIDEIIIFHADPQQAAIEFVERYQDHKGLPIYIYGDASGRVGEKHGQMSSWIKVKQYLTNAGFNVIMRVPKGNPAIRDGQNAVRAKVFDAHGKRTFFVNPAKCKTIDEGMMTLKTKEGSTFLEDEKANSQHVLSALRYMFYQLWPVRMKK